MKLLQILITVFSITVLLLNIHPTISQEQDEQSDSERDSPSEGESQPIKKPPPKPKPKVNKDNYNASFNYTDSWYLNNYVKYFEALKIYSKKTSIDGKSKAESRLKIPIDYQDKLNESCTDPELWYTIIGNFTTLGETEELFVKRLNKEKDVRDKACLFKNSIPVMKCNEESKICECLDIPRSPYGFFYGWHQEANRSICYAKTGAICHDGYLPCATGTKCTDGICGSGVLSLLQRFNEGRVVQFTETDLTQIVGRDSSLEEIIADLMRHDTGTMETPVERECSMDIWSVSIAEKYVELLTVLGTEEDPTEVFNQIESESPGLQDIPASFEESADNNLEELIKTIPCLDQFPSMTCGVDPVTEVSRCVCTDLPPPFRYVLENNRCVGLMGSICTTVHGDIECSEDIRCETLTKRDGTPYKDLPNVLSSLEIKVCGGMGALGLRSGMEDKPSKRSGVTKNLSSIFPVTFVTLISFGFNNWK